MVLRLGQPLSFAGDHALREEELDLEGRGGPLGEQRAAHEWPAHTRDLVWSKGSGEAGDERTNGGRVDEQPLEIEPEVRVVSRFEAEMAMPGGREAQDVRAHPRLHITFDPPAVPALQATPQRPDRAPGSRGTAHPCRPSLPATGSCHGNVRRWPASYPRAL